MKTGIFIDLDGTLINGKKQISAYDKRVIDAVKTKHNVYLITGKSLVNALPYYQQLNLKTKLITSMGQLISWPGHAQFENIFSPTNLDSLNVVLKEIKSKLQIRNILLETASEKYYVSKRENSNMIKLICHDFKRIFLLKKMEINDIIGTYLEMAKEDEVSINKITIALNKKYNNWFTFSFWKTEGHHPIIHLKPVHVGKSQAVNIVKKLDNLAKVIAFGNGWSDYNMIKQADIGVAMINADSKIQSGADLVSIASNDHSGLGKTLVKILKLKI